MYVIAVVNSMLDSFDMSCGCSVHFFCCFFFFQAEDGIRDLVRSRGLGDVYKRQAHESAFVTSSSNVFIVSISMINFLMFSLVDDLTPVSYTHLTLPTSDLV